MFGILDSALTNLPTSDPGGAFLLVDIEAAAPAVQTFAADTPYTAVGAPVITFPQAVPESGAVSLWLTSAVFGSLVALRRRTR